MRTEVARRLKRPTTGPAYVGKNADSPWEGQKFLLARRLVEAGVPVVTLRAGGWDHHGNVVSSQGGTIFISLRSALPLLDQSIHALLTDLAERGLDKHVTVLLWGEMGRSPRIGTEAGRPSGRDHWAQASFALLSGAGLRMGQTVGDTGPRAERIAGAPFTPQNVLATLYHVLGIDPRQSFKDLSGRPIPILDEGRAIEEIV